MKAGDKVQTIEGKTATVISAYSWSCAVMTDIGRYHRTKVFKK